MTFYAFDKKCHENFTVCSSLLLYLGVKANINCPLSACIVFVSALCFSFLLAFVCLLMPLINCDALQLKHTRKSMRAQLLSCRQYKRMLDEKRAREEKQRVEQELFDEEDNNNIPDEAQDQDSIESLEEAPTEDPLDEIHVPRIDQTPCSPTKTSTHVHMLALFSHFSY
jgi:hypothetical protein